MHSIRAVGPVHEGCGWQLREGQEVDVLGGRLDGWRASGGDLTRSTRGKGDPDMLSSNSSLSSTLQLDLKGCLFVCGSSGMPSPQDGDVGGLW